MFRRKSQVQMNEMAPNKLCEFTPTSTTNSSGDDLLQPESRIGAGPIWVDVSPGVMLESILDRSWIHLGPISNRCWVDFGPLLCGALVEQLGEVSHDGGCGVCIHGGYTALARAREHGKAFATLPPPKWLRGVWRPRSRSLKRGRCLHESGQYLHGRRICVRSRRSCCSVPRSHRHSTDQFQPKSRAQSWSNPGRS